MKQEHSTKKLGLDAPGFWTPIRPPAGIQEHRHVSSHYQQRSQHRQQCATASPPRRTGKMRRSATRSDSPYQQRTTQKDNPTQLLIKQAVDYLIEQLNAGQSDMLVAYLRTMARFHNYSFGNILQIARQRPTATRVAGFGKWKELGRFVKKGEKGIQILAPVVELPPQEGGSRAGDRRQAVTVS